MTMPTPRIIDLSHHNVIFQDLREARAAGILGVIHKLTEGNSYVDDEVVARRFLAMDADMAWGLYHFLRPGDMQQQARFFLDTAYALDVIDDDTVLVADHEDQSVSGQELKEFLDEVEELSERSPVVYSGHVLKEQLEGTGYHPKRRLWLCQYANTPVLPEGVDKYWLWQYTDNGECPGIAPPVDLNHFDGDEDAFLASWSGQYEIVPAPEPAEPVEVTITIAVKADVPIKVIIKEG